MNKKQFVNILREQLRPLAETERQDLLQDYEAHFEAGMQMGKTEEEIAQDLGDPMELARDILGERFEYVRFSPKSEHNSSPARKILVAISLVFLNLVAVPFGIAAWGIWFSLTVCAVLFILTPIISLADVILYGNSALVKVFLSMVLAGIGIFLGLGMAKTWSVLKHTTIRYVHWNIERIGE